MAMIEASSCVTTTQVVPSVSRRLRINLSSPAEVTGSSPAEGSSSIKIGGSSAKARAMAARLIMPPESSEGRRRAASPNPTSPSFSRAISAQAAAGISVNTESGRETFSSRFIEPNNAPDWNITPICRRTACASRFTLWPATVMSPCRWRQQADHLFQQGGFAAARTAENDENFPHLDVETDIAEDGARAKDLCGAQNLNHRAHRLSL